MNKNQILRLQLAQLGDLEVLLERWNIFYMSRYGMKIQFPDFKQAVEKALADIKDPKLKDLPRFIQPMHPCIKGPETAVQEYNKYYNAKGDRVLRLYDDSLDELYKNDRREKGLYVIIHHGREIPDEKYFNQSFLAATEKGVRTMRLAEYVTFADFYRFEDREGKKVDEWEFTACPESIDAKGDVARVDFSYGGLRIWSTSSNVKCSNQAVREVIYSAAA